ncbi:4-(cytidine 5'-diphospho)-2-C-methyl-D-erythritol kinase [Ancylobacter sp. VNQ12]|uniref:4-(cytidine 5'-diphospho)-2-C-methyl-D-erythritol kinase n=1 Tax=Ancylobacter sp. VNQ12 TaxID=3400920 RepID=UPI003C033F57
MPTAPAFAPESDALTERAPAKVNLTLRVLGRRADGYHELSSVVAFAGTGDRLSLTPGGELALALAGPGAPVLADDDNNLVLRAARELDRRVPGLVAGRFGLDKRLPIAAGIGGGSSDAAAALRLLARANHIAPDDPRLHEAALATGSDVPACLYGRSCLMAGRGEAITPLDLPRFGAVLVNPRVPIPTAEVFRALALAPGARLADASAVPAFASRAAMVAWLIGQPNDLEPPAHRLAPVLDEVAAALRATPGVLLARMSGSGATLFALYEDCRAAARAAKQVAGSHPAWWVKSTILG